MTSFMNGAIDHSTPADSYTIPSARLSGSMLVLINGVVLHQAFDANCCHDMGTAIKHPVPDRVKLSLVIFDIQAL